MKKMALQHLPKTISWLTRKFLHVRFWIVFAVFQGCDFRVSLGRGGREVEVGVHRLQVAKHPRRRAAFRPDHALVLERRIGMFWETSDDVFLVFSHFLMASSFGYSFTCRLAYLLILNFQLLLTAAYLTCRKVTNGVLIRLCTRELSKAFLSLTRALGVLDRTEG